MNEADLAMRVVAERLESLDRIWDLVTNSEAADQDTIAVADIRAALTTRRAS
jgi:two-component sensor histidine kinase